MKTLKNLCLSLLLIGALSQSARSWPQRTFGATIVSQNAGDRAAGISVTVGTSTPVAIYTGAAKHREILLINLSQNYYIYVATHSAVSSSSGPRALIPKATSSAPGTFVTNATATIYAILESAAGSSTQEIIGWVEYDKGDGP